MGKFFFLGPCTLISTECIIITRQFSATLCRLFEWMWVRVGEPCSEGFLLIYTKAG